MARIMGGSAVFRRDVSLRQIFDRETVPGLPAGYMLGQLFFQTKVPEKSLSQESHGSVGAKRRNLNRTFLDSARQSRELLRELVKRRKRQRLSQAEVAARMGTSQSAIARIETGGMDIRMSTLERYAAALGHQLHYKLTRLPSGTSPAAGKKRSAS